MNTEHYFEAIGAWLRSDRGNSLIGAYLMGFLLSLFCTGAAFFLVLHHVFSVTVLIGVITVLALAQVVAQIHYFLHMGKGIESRARLIMLGLTSLIVFILVAGSLWIMVDLNQRMMPSVMQMDTYMQTQTGI